MHQKRPICIKGNPYASKETYMHQKKRDLYASKETYMHQKRPICIERDLYASNETKFWGLGACVGKSVYICIYVYMYICIYIYTCIRTCKYIYIYICIHVYIYMNTCVSFCQSFLMYRGLFSCIQVSFDVYRSLLINTGLFW